MKKFWIFSAALFLMISSHAKCSLVEEDLFIRDISENKRMAVKGVSYQVLLQL